MKDGVICFLGIGSNIGDAAANCAAAVKRISDVDGVRALRCSSLYKTQPVGFEEQDWFVNGVVEIRTMLWQPSNCQKLLREILSVSYLSGNWAVFCPFL